MNYFDAAYLARLYLPDPGYPAVRALAETAPVACSIIGRAETISAFHRQLRESKLTRAQFAAVNRQFTEDWRAGGIYWIPVSTSVLEVVEQTYASLPGSICLRAADAIHLATAAVANFKVIFSNDRHLSAAASFFGLRCDDVIGR